MKLYDSLGDLITEVSDSQSILHVLLQYDPWDNAVELLESPQPPTLLELIDILIDKYNIMVIKEEK